MRFIYTKTFAVFAACVVLLALFALMQTRGLLDPIRRWAVELPRPVVRASRAVASPVKHFFTTLYSLKRINKDNIALQEKNTQLELKLAALEQTRLENELLRKELGFEAPAGREKLPCTVLVQDPQGITDTVLLSCGERDGIRAGQGMVSNGYLIGRVLLASKTSSTAQLITSPDSSIDVRLTETGVSGLVKGSYGSGLILDLVSQNSDAKPGQLLVTAGINDMIPRGLLIGEVGEVVSKPNDLFKKTTILSPIDMRNLQYVFVIK